MKKFNYYIITTQNYLSEDRLNELGEQGWELIIFEPPHELDEAYFYRFIFKKEI
jgi:hypothetical protein